MERIVVEGGNRLKGEVSISGMKNSILPIIFACLLVEDECIIENVPRVSDVYNALKILRSMGAFAEFSDVHTVTINTKNATPNIKAVDLVCQMRASAYLMGAMLSRFGEVTIPMPGGCNFGARPIDLHIKGFESLGAECIECNNEIHIKSIKKLKCNKITLDKISVGATINMVIVSALIKGITVIENAAREPHVDDVINFLNSCGADIVRRGATVVCRGVKSLHGTEYCIFPDMIEALTYITLVGACKGEISLNGANVNHLNYELNLFKSMGYEITSCCNRLTVKADDIMGRDVVTAPYPSFPTDLHPQFASLLCKTENGGKIQENVFPNRFAYVSELKKMGANIKRTGNTVIVKHSNLRGAILNATDLRAGAGLVIASLCADGESEINNVNYIVRGYENLVDKICSIGGNIKLIKGE